MNTAELLGKITPHDLFPIRVEGSTEKEEGGGLTFIGNFEEFIKAAKALNAKVVFVFTRILQESDFMYEVEDGLYDEDDLGATTDNEDFDDDKTEPEPPKEIYLPTILPSIREYKKYIGIECVFKLSLQAETSFLDYYLYESWWNEFVELREKAIEKIEEDEYKIMQKVEESRKKLEEERRVKEKTQISQLKKLINDKDFVRLPTQLAMKAYALEKIPELTELNPSTLTIEIQDLNGRIIAKGLRRRK